MGLRVLIFLSIFIVGVSACRVDSDCWGLSSNTSICDRESIVPCIEKDYQCALSRTNMVYAVAGDQVHVHCDYSSGNLGYCTFLTSRVARRSEPSSLASLPLGPVIACRLSECSIAVEQGGAQLAMSCHNSTCSCAGECDRFITQALSRIDGACDISCHSEQKNCTISHHAFPIPISASCSEESGGSVYECREPAALDCLRVGEKTMTAVVAISDPMVQFCVAAWSLIAVVIVGELLLSCLFTLVEKYKITRGELAYLPYQGVVDHVKIKELRVLTFSNEVLAEAPAMKFAPGHIYIVMGKSGSGKTTFFRALSGKIPLGRLNSLRCVRNVSVDNHTKLDDSHRELFSLCLTEGTKMPGAKIKQQLTFTALINRREESQVTEYMERLGIGYLSNRLVSSGLSRGETTRFQICEALLGCQPVLILDEPFANLDIESQKKMASTIHHEASRGRIIILATHDSPDSIYKKSYDRCHDNIHIIRVKDGWVQAPVELTTIVNRLGVSAFEPIGHTIAEHYAETFSSTPINFGSRRDTEESFVDVPIHNRGMGTSTSAAISPGDTDLDIEMVDKSSEDSNDNAPEAGAGGGEEEEIGHIYRIKQGREVMAITKYASHTMARIWRVFESAHIDWSALVFNAVISVLMMSVLWVPTGLIAETVFDIGGCKSRFIFMVITCVVLHALSLHYTLTIEDTIDHDSKRIVAGQYSVRDMLHGRIIMSGILWRLLSVSSLLFLVHYVLFPGSLLSCAWFGLVGGLTFFIGSMVNLIIYAFTIRRPYATTALSLLILIIFCSFSGMLSESSGARVAPHESYVRWLSPWTFSIESFLCNGFNGRTIQVNVSEDLFISVDGSYWIKLLGYDPNGFYRDVACLVLISIVSYYAAYLVLKKSVLSHGRL